jgi:protein-disulfide isomerase
VSLVRSLPFAAAVLAALSCTPSDAAREAPAAAAASSTPAPAADSVTGDSIALARADSSRIRGAPDAPLWIVEISDFQCPFCKQWHDSTYGRLMRDYVTSGKARFAYLNLPLPNHANAVPAAEAAMCAGLQGRFWEMHDGLFAQQAQWASVANPWPVFTAIATSRGIDAAAMRACGDADTVLPLIQADASRAMQAGVRSTPTFLVGSVLLEGAYPFDAMKQVIDSLLAARGP